jgi:hypothetical protein
LLAGEIDYPKVWRSFVCILACVKVVDAPESALRWWLA